MTIRLPTACLVVLIGPSGAGKSTWAQSQFRPEQIVSSDGLRALVGEGPFDQKAGKDAFEVLELVLHRRLARRLLTVVDTLGLDAGRREAFLALAQASGLACHAVLFDTAPAVCRERNRRRERPVPARVLSDQIRALGTARSAVPLEGFDAVHSIVPDVIPDAAGGAVPPAERVEVVPAAMVGAASSADRQEQQPATLRFGLQLPSFTWAGSAAEVRDRLTELAADAERAGFSSLWVMDHLLQIPQVGHEWDPMLDSYTTLGFLAAVTRTCRIGALVTGVTYRNPAHLAKIVATLDVLSGGRAVCGLGAAWFEREHRVYGWDFPPRAQRLDLLEDVLRLLPLMWGPGAPPFEGHRLRIPAAICYPRPIQSHIPILVGGQGERRTLRLVAQYADACNLFGQADIVAHKLGVLARHCADVGREYGDIEVTHLSRVLCAADRTELKARLAATRPKQATPEAYAESVQAGTVEDHIGRFRDLSDAGVHTAIVSLADLAFEAAVPAFAPVIAAFDRPEQSP